MTMIHRADVESHLRALNPETPEEEIEWLYQRMREDLNERSENLAQMMRKQWRETMGRPPSGQEWAQLSQRAMQTAHDQIYEEYLGPISEAISQAQLENEEEEIWEAHYWALESEDGWITDLDKIHDNDEINLQVIDVWPEKSSMWRVYATTYCQRLELLGESLPFFDAPELNARLEKEITAALRAHGVTDVPEAK
ncbi:hypothetical protein [Corynebacterium lowii]|uniref:Uncharacterized protein n=1 Tax=Corynebacterium lowii TaxID=1544413 RepID=A0A0N8W0N4_9CORY|nr:hypothetical protein [Corynebacterium lowii]KQB87186.1 hypothetical protein Clow_00239 [Corynebacterium lowii]MDP9852227.1 hypothetical protein [Corynebacterium lowii]